MNTHHEFGTELPINLTKKMHWLLSEIFYNDEEIEPLILPNDRPVLEKYICLEKL